MDRLEIRQIHPASVPGLVPMFLGAPLRLCAVLLFSSHPPARADTQRETGSNRDLLICGDLCVAYAVRLLGRVPFVAATAIFIASFVLVFSDRDVPRRGYRMAFVIGFANVFATAIGALQGNITAKLLARAGLKKSTVISVALSGAGLIAVDGGCWRARWFSVWRQM